MKNLHPLLCPAFKWSAFFASCLLLVVASAAPARAGSWNKIEPLRSRRVDVERVLGQPMPPQPGEDGVLHFKVAGGVGNVEFVTPRFTASRNLSRKLEGTVLLMVLEHQNSSDTPESLGLDKKKGFDKQEEPGAVI